MEKLRSTAHSVGEVGRDVPGAPRRVRGGSGGPALP